MKLSNKLTQITKQGRGRSLTPNMFQKVELYLTQNLVLDIPQKLFQNQSLLIKTKNILSPLQNIEK